MPTACMGQGCAFTAACPQRPIPLKVPSSSCPPSSVRQHNKGTPASVVAAIKKHKVQEAAIAERRGKLTVGYGGAEVPWC